MTELPPELELRTATNADRAAVTELIVSILTSYGLSPDHSTTDRDLADIEDFYADGFFDVLVERKTGRVIGTVGLHPMDKGTAELRKMYLDKGYRGRGLGRILLDHALAKARTAGVKRVVLETATVLREALQLYTAAGFRPCAPLKDKSKRCDQTLELIL